MENRLSEAYKALMVYLFKEVPENVQSCAVTRSDYTQALQHVETEFSIHQGDPDYLPWVLTLLGRSPLIIEDEGGL